MIHRRTFIGALGGSLATAPLLGKGHAKPKRLAVVATEWRLYSHAWHTGQRFLAGYPVEGRWHQSPIRLVSAYVDQKPENDLSRDRAREFGFPIYPTIAETLRCGGDKLAVDVVLVIGEHGRYPVNDLGQKLYPRYEFFKEVVEVFKQDGRTVPVFKDKHLLLEMGLGQGDGRHGPIDGVSVSGRLIFARHLENAGHRHALWRRGRGSDVRGLGRRGQLRHPRPGDDSVHGRAPPGRGNRSRLAPGVTGRSGLECHGKRFLRPRGLGPATVPVVPLPKPQAHSSRKT